MNSGAPRFESHRERRVWDGKRAHTSSVLSAQAARKGGRTPIFQFAMLKHPLELLRRVSRLRLLTRCCAKISSARNA
jgi:hypothetical protein